MNQVSFTQVRIEDHFWSERLQTHQNVTLPVCMEQCEKTGKISNFDKAAGIVQGEFTGIFFNDSDVYKLLEGVAYSLMTNPDPELEGKADEIIDKIAAAQEKDGYLDTYYTLKEPDKKWTDMAMHEMYCGGHLIEAAVAYKQATGKTKLLEAACKLADHYDSLFGPGKRHWVEGHEEIELALVKLYRETNEQRYWKLAQWLLEERGHDHGKGYSWDEASWGKVYCQDDKPVREITDVKGHAVRAMFLYTGMADVAAISGDEGYITALNRVWESVVLRNMYITGGIGPSGHNEGFSEDYDMPNETSYCETCASVGMVYWNHRMNLLQGDSKYADVIERELYNGVLSGVSLSGDRFFYANRLASNGTVHRREWFECSCCPTNICRFIPSIGDYIYATAGDGIFINQYVGGTGTMTVANQRIKLKQVTNYPWEGNVSITVYPEHGTEFAIMLRLPGWCKRSEVRVNGKVVDTYLMLEKGYIKLQRNWSQGDVITLLLDMPVERIYSHPKVRANAGKVALQRGPIVYCLEEADNPSGIAGMELPVNALLTAQYKENLLGGIVVIEGAARKQDLDKWSGTLYSTDTISTDEFRIKAIPYYAWDNREAGAMTVWITEGQGGTI